MKLPKLYRVCWVKLYWLTDTCEDGEHVQRDGYHILKARRALRPDKSWFWQIDKWDARQCERELSQVDDLNPEDMFEGVIYKDPYLFDERNLGYTWSRSTIKEKIEIEEIKKSDDLDFDNWPF